MWFTILIIAIIVGGVIGFLSSDSDNRGEGAISGAFTGGIGCAYVLFQIFCFGIGIAIIIWLFRALFG